MFHDTIVTITQTLTQAVVIVWGGETWPPMFLARQMMIMMNLLLIFRQMFQFLLSTFVENPPPQPFFCNITFWGYISRLFKLRSDLRASFSTLLKYKFVWSFCSPNFSFRPLFILPEVVASWTLALWNFPLLGWFRFLPRVLFSFFLFYLPL